MRWKLNICRHIVINVKESNSFEYFSLILFEIKTSFILYFDLISHILTSCMSHDCFCYRSILQSDCFFHLKFCRFKAKRLPYHFHMIFLHLHYNIYRVTSVPASRSRLPERLVDIKQQCKNL